MPQGNPHASTQRDDKDQVDDEPDHSDIEQKNLMCLATMKKQHTTNVTTKASRNLMIIKFQ